MKRVSDKVMMIGIDAADVDYIQSNIGSLPNLKRVFDEGRMRRLDTPAEVMSASVWPTFYTGTMPGEHGYYFPMQWDPEQMRLRRVTRDWLYCEPFWYGLARNAVNVTAFDVQTEFPGDIERGTEIINWGAQSFDSFYCNKAEVGKAVRGRFGKHPMGPDVPVHKSLNRLSQIRSDLVDGVRLRGDMARWLCRETDWDLFIAVFVECHRGGHNLWPDPAGDGSDVPSEGLLSVYKATDDEVGRLLACVDLRDTAVIVFALHGMGPNTSQMHLLPRVMDRVNETFDGRHSKLVRGSRSPGLMRALRERMPARIQEQVARSVPESVRDWVTARAFGDGVRKRGEPGFVLPSGTEGSVRCNLIGRENPGVIEHNGEIHRRYMDHVRASVLSLRHQQTDTPAVREVHCPSQAFSGKRAHYLPDMTFSWTDQAPAHILESAELGTITRGIPTGRGGNHRAPGFVAALGALPSDIELPPLRHIADFSRFISAVLTREDG